MRVAIIGIGNELRGDDAIGLLAAEKMEKEIGKECKTLLLKTNAPENIVGTVSEFHPDIIIAVDAADYGGLPGDVRIIDPKADERPNSTHSAPLGIFFEALKNASNAKAYLVGIQIKTNAFGEGISKEVMRSLDHAVSLGRMIVNKHR